MNCHIVPQCYLKSWKVPTTKSSIYIFDKSKTLAINSNKNIENLSDTNFAFEDKYLIDYFNKDYMFKFHAHFFAIISDLNIIAMCDGTKILDENDYNNCLENIDKWIYTIECANPEGNEDLSKDPHFNLYGWKWSKGYDSVDAIGKLYTRGEAVDMVFNKHYTFVKYLATQHLSWENGVVSFMKDTALERQVMTLEEIWEKLPDVPAFACRCAGRSQTPCWRSPRWCRRPG